MLDSLLVGSVLLVSVVYAIFSLAPRALKRGLLAGVAAVFRALPHMPGFSSLASRLEAAAAIKTKGECGGCDTCGSEPTKTTESAGVGRSEVSIPVSKIERR